MPLPEDVEPEITPPAAGLDGLVVATAPDLVPEAYLLLDVTAEDDVFRIELADPEVILLDEVELRVTPVLAGAAERVPDVSLSPREETADEVRGLCETADPPKDVEPLCP